MEVRRAAVVLVSLSAFLALQMPASAASRPIIGLWPEGTGGYAEYLEIANGAGVEIPYFRGRQRDGQFDADRELVMPEAEMAAAAGLSIGMNIQPKTGSGQNRVGSSTPTSPHRSVRARVRSTTSSSRWRTRSSRCRSTAR